MTPYNYAAATAPHPIFRAPLPVRAVVAEALRAVAPAGPAAMWNTIDALHALPSEAENATAGDRAKARDFLAEAAETMHRSGWTEYAREFSDAAETLK